MVCKLCFETLIGIRRYVNSFFFLSQWANGCTKFFRSERSSHVRVTCSPAVCRTFALLTEFCFYLVENSSDHDPKYSTGKGERGPACTRLFQE